MQSSSIMDAAIWFQDKAVCTLTTNAFQEYPGQITTGGGFTSLSQHGIYKFNIPLHDGSQTTMSGVCYLKSI